MSDDMKFIVTSPDVDLLDKAYGLVGCREDLQIIGNPSDRPTVRGLHDLLKTMPENVGVDVHNCVVLVGHGFVVNGRTGFNGCSVIGSKVDK